MKFSKKIISIENSTLIYDQYLQLGVLERFSLDALDEIINLHAFVAFNSSVFLKIQNQTLIKLLEMNTLLIDELDLFSACVRWLRADAERQKEEESAVDRVKLFNSFKHLIRFPLIAERDFFGEKTRMLEGDDDEPEVIAPVRSGLFTAGELEEFRSYYKSKNPTVLSTSYNFNQRNGLRVGKLIYDWRMKNYRMADIDEQLPDHGDCVYFENGVYMDDRVKKLRPKPAKEPVKVAKLSGKETRVWNPHEWEIDGKTEDSIIAGENSVQEDETNEIRLFKVQKVGAGSSKSISLCSYNGTSSNANQFLNNPFFLPYLSLNLSRFVATPSSRSS